MRLSLLLTSSGYIALSPVNGIHFWLLAAELMKTCSTKQCHAKFVAESREAAVALVSAQTERNQATKAAGGGSTLVARVVVFLALLIVGAITTPPLYAVNIVVCCFRCCCHCVSNSHYSCARRRRSIISEPYCHYPHAQAVLTLSTHAGCHRFLCIYVPLLFLWCCCLQCFLAAALLVLYPVFRSALQAVWWWSVWVQ